MQIKKIFVPGIEKYLLDIVHALLYFAFPRDSWHREVWAVYG